MLIRLRVDNALQVDFVNKKIPRVKDIVITSENFIIDNLDNILSNKLTAVINRDNPRDIFDIYLIYKFHTFSWRYILEVGHQKVFF